MTRFRSNTRQKAFNNNNLNMTHDDSMSLKTVLGGLTFYLMTTVQPVLAQTLSPLEHCQHAIKTQESSDAIAECIEQLKTISEESNQKQRLSAAKIKLDIARLYRQQGNQTQQDYYLASVKTSQAYVEHPSIQYQWLRSVGLDLLHKRDFEEAVQYLTDAYDIAKQEDSIEDLAKSSNDLGLVYYKLGEYKLSLLHYKESLNYKETIGNPYYIGTTLNNLGLIHKDLKDYPLALSYYEQALDHFLTYTEQPEFDQRVFNNISHLYEDLAVTNSLAGNLEKGQQYVDKIINTFSNKLASDDKVRALKNLALVHIRQQEPKKAELFIDQAITITDSADKYLDEIHYVQAAIAWLNDDYTSAHEYAELALNKAANLGKDQTQKNTYQLLYQMALKQKHYEQAVKYQSQYFHYEELAQKAQYQSDLKVIEEQIQKERIERQLISEQLKSERQENKIQSLSNTVLLISLILLTAVFIAAFIIYRKAKEKQALLQSIKSHKEKLILLESENDAEDAAEHDTHINTTPTNIEPVNFRQLLVDLLVDTIAIWEKSTQTDRIELADKSKIWKVSIDDGRLRTRSLDKYIDINKIPQNPRWRNVVKTCHYVLAECRLDTADREMLEVKLEAVMAEIKAQSLGKSS